MNWTSGILRISVSLAVVWAIFIAALLWTAQDSVEPVFFLKVAMIPALVIILLGAMISWVIRGFTKR